MSGAAVGRRLPRLKLRDSAGRSFRLSRTDRRATVVVFLHGPDCPACRDRLRALGTSAGELAAWDARPVAVVRASAEEARRLTEDLGRSFPVLADPDGAARARYGVGDQEVALFVADRFGEIFAAERAGDADGLSPTAELEEWARFLTTQCPECGVPDVPGRGAWA